MASAVANWRARTESGAAYERRGADILYIASMGGFQTFHNANIYAVDEDLLANEEGRLDWEYLSSLTPCEFPVMGRRMYLRTLKEWRITTHIVDVVMM
jgi:hypothetical protein